jgi:hypothetical protein
LPAADTPKTANSSGAPRLMKTWMRLAAAGGVGLCGLLSIGYFLSPHPQPQLSQQELQQPSVIQLKAPASPSNPDNDEAERIKQKKLDQINQNFRINQKFLDQADAALDQADWKSWQLALDYANRALNSEDSKIIDDANAKIDEETRRVNQANKALKPKPSPTPTAELRSLPSSASKPSQQSSSAPITFDVGSSSQSEPMNKDRCEASKRKYYAGDPETMRSMSKTVQKQCKEAGVMIDLD